jgi:hypothetical protein
MRNLKYYTLVLPFVFFAIFEYFIKKPTWLFIVLNKFFNPAFFLFLLIIFLFLIFYLIAKRAGVSLTWLSILLPVNFEIALIGYIILLTDMRILQLLIIGNSLMLFWYFRYLIISRGEYSPDVFSLRSNLYSLLSYLTVFFYSAVFFRLPFFVKLSIWQLLLAYLFGVAIAVYSIFDIDLKNFKKSSFYTLLSIFVLAEIAWSLSFLPLHYNLLGLILSIGYYSLIGVSRQYLVSSLAKKSLRYYLFISLLSILSILLTSKWM